MIHVEPCRGMNPNLIIAYTFGRMMIIFLSSLDSFAAATINHD